MKAFMFRTFLLCAASVLVGLFLFYLALDWWNTPEPECWQSRYFDWTAVVNFFGKQLYGTN